MTDVDILHESKDGADALMEALISQQVCPLLVQNLERLDDNVKEESDGIHNTLGSVIHLVPINTFQNIYTFLR